MDPRNAYFCYLFLGRTNQAHFGPHLGYSATYMLILSRGKSAGILGKLMAYGSTGLWLPTAGSGMPFAQTASFCLLAPNAGRSQFCPTLVGTAERNYTGLVFFGHDPEQDLHPTEVVTGGRLPLEWLAYPGNQVEMLLCVGCQSPLRASTRWD